MTCYIKIKIYNFIYNDEKHIYEKHKYETHLTKLQKDD